MIEPRELDSIKTELNPCLLGYRGSIAHNMYVPKNDPKSIDDVDLMGFVIADKKYYLGLLEWGTHGTKDFFRDQYDYVFYDIRKAFKLLLQGNPNILGMLWLRPEHYLYLNDAGKEILDNRKLFVGKHVYQSFAGYASAQLQKMELRDPLELRWYLALTWEAKNRGIHPTDNINTESNSGTDDIFLDVKAWSSEKILIALKKYQKKGDNIGYLGDKRKQLVLNYGYDAKNAAHCIRLLRMAKAFLLTGDPEVYRTADRDELLAIKAGAWRLEHIKEQAEQLFQEVKAAHVASVLPDGPDYAGAEELLVRLISDSFDLKTWGRVKQ